MQVTAWIAGGLGSALLVLSSWAWNSQATKLEATDDKVGAHAERIQRLETIADENRRYLRDIKNSLERLEGAVFFSPRRPNRDVPVPRRDIIQSVYDFVEVGVPLLPQGQLPMQEDTPRQAVASGIRGVLPQFVQPYRVCRQGVFLQSLRDFLCGRNVHEGVPPLPKDHPTG